MASDGSSAGAPVRPPRVLTVLPDYPFPPTTGLHLRMVGNLDLVRRLGCESHLAYFSTEGRRHAPESGELRALCASAVHLAARRPQGEFSRAALLFHKLDFLVGGALGLGRGRYPFSMRYDAVAGAALVARHARAIGADVVILPSFLVHWAAWLKEQGIAVVADAADVQGELTRRFLDRYAGRSRGGRLGLLANHLACRTQEARYLPLCREIWCTSEPEAQALARIAPDCSVLVVPNTIDESAVPAPGRPGRAAIGFIGTYSYPPNRDAAEFLALRVMPKVLQVVPSARLVLAGAGMSPRDARRLAETPSVDFLGVVPGVAEFFAACDVVALPIFVRGGVPVKLVESLAHRLPVIASADLVAGLGLEDGSEVLVAGDADDFARKIVSVLRDRTLAGAVADNGQKAFLARWSRASAVHALRAQSFLAGDRRAARVCYFPVRNPLRATGRRT